jgi:cell division inhibitor SepF
VLASSARTLNAKLQNVRVEIPDLMADDPVMEIRGEASAENKHALEYVQASPVRGYLNGFTDPIRAGGQGRLDLYLHYPFREGLPVIMNLEAADREVSRRLIDFASGLCYGLNGSMEKVATGVYLLKPIHRPNSYDESGYGG